MQRSWRPAAMAMAVLLAIAPTALAASPSPSGHHAPGGPVDLGSPAAELRVDLDRLLAEHAFLTIEQMRSGLVDSPDFAAAATAVEANSTEVAAAIGSIYGDAAIEPFGDIWRSHIGYLVDYSIGLREVDAPAREAALAGLADYRDSLRTFLADANPGVELAEIAEALDMHTAQLIEFIDATHEGDHRRAYALEREAYPHMFEVGDALARVIANRFPDRYTGVDVAYSAAGTLRVVLDRLLAEHAFLAAEAMRSGVSGAPDFGAAAQAIGGNSADLQGVVEAAYGAEAGDAFRNIWDGHITGYVAYIDAARANDPAARTAATNSVNTYVHQLAAFFAGANPHLDAGVLEVMFQEHAGHLTAQVEAFAAADYDTTYATVRAGYRHMFDAGEALASAIATQMPDKFPADAEAPDTAMLPHAHQPEPAGQWSVLLLIGSVVVALVIWAMLSTALLGVPGRRARSRWPR
jgi:hypothetical protein